MKTTPGDVVHVKGTVTRCMADDTVAVRFGGGGYVWIDGCDIVCVEPRQFKVGDAVIWNSKETGIIVAIDAQRDQAWIRGKRLYEEYGVIASLDKLKRAP